MVSLARHAMGSRFEILLPGEADPMRLRAAGEEALAEVERIEAQLSVYRPGSEISHINALAHSKPVRVGPEVFSLLQRALELYRISGGAFDITVAPLVRAWGFMEGEPRQPDAVQLDALRRCVGMRHLILNPDDFTVRFDTPGTMIELGAIGKGYAIEVAAERLLEAGIDSALLHGGTSTVYAIGTPPGEGAWRIALEDPTSSRAAAEASAARGGMRVARSAAVQQQVEAEACKPASSIELELKDASLSVSAPAGKFFESDGKFFGHVIDPRSGQPAGANLLAAVVLPSGTETDALSTALLVMGTGGVGEIRDARPEIKSWIIDGQGRLAVDGAIQSQDTGDGEPRGGRG